MKICFRLYCLVFLFSLANQALSNSEKQLDDKYQGILLESYTLYKHRTVDNPLKLSRFDDFYRAFGLSQKSIIQNNPLALIAANESLLLDHIDDPRSIQVFRYLLDIEAVDVAENLYNEAITFADSYTSAKLNYHLGKYYFDSREWQKTQDYLTRIETKTSLEAAQSDYATLMFGITLQHQKQHRLAIKYYESIAPKSEYYTDALLNIAVAYIRQNWWTDAQVAIEKALNDKHNKKSSEFTNRLYLVLGYNQFQHEFYRDARETFRKVALNSQYANQALLGIGLCALNQSDFIGAVNAFGILKEKQELSLPIFESHLLYAYTHEQMGEKELASAHYESAIAFYNQMILSISQGSGTLVSWHQSDHTTLQSRSKILKTLNELPSLTNALRADIVKLETNYRDYITELKAQNKKDAADILTSYLSQAQFGQTKIFDTYN